MTVSCHKIFTHVFSQQFEGYQQMWAVCVTEVKYIKYYIEVTMYLNLHDNLLLSARFWRQMSIKKISKCLPEMSQELLL